MSKLTQKVFKPLKRVPKAVTNAKDDILERLKIPKSINPAAMRGWLEITLLSLYERGRLDQWDEEATE